MQPHEERVVKEADDLHEKLNKLGEFIHGEVFKTLHPPDQQLLQDQDEHMRGYLGVLRKRIGRFTV